MTDPEPPKPFATNLLPPPTEKLDPATALTWLQEVFPCAHVALTFGFDSEDKETREAFAIVSMDIGSLHSACVEAVE